MAVAMKFWLVDWPAQATFLTPEERQVLLARLEINKSEEAKMSRWNTNRIVYDPKIWLGALMYLGIVCTNYSTSFFIPTILQEVGFEAIPAQVSIL